MEILRDAKGKVVIKNAELVKGWPTNFEGRPTKINPNGGERSINVVIDDPNVAQTLLEEGWNVKIKKPYEEGDPAVNYIPVKIGFDPRFPVDITVATSKNKVSYDENTVKGLDGAVFSKINLELKPYKWAKNGKSGIAAYLSVFHGWLEESMLSDDFDDDMPF